MNDLTDQRTNPAILDIQDSMAEALWRGPMLPARGFFALEPAVLRRGLVEATQPTSASDDGPDGRGAATELSIAARSFAAFVGVDPALSTTPAERLVHAVGNELWFVGAFPSWVAACLLVPLGAAPDDAFTLLDGEPLSFRTDLAEAADLAAFGPEVAVLDMGRALAWRAMLRNAVQAYTDAPPAVVADVAQAAGLADGERPDRVVFSFFASLLEVVDFAADGHEVLIGGAA